MVLAIHAYTELKGDVPRNSEGKASLLPLIDDRRIEPSDAKCTHGRLFVINPGLEVADVLDLDRPRSTTWLVHDEQSLHEGTYALFVRGGVILVYKVDPEEYREWLCEFSRGEREF